MPDKNQVRLRTIPNSNLTQRKNDVLRIHKENLQFVTKLAEMKAKQDMLIPLDKQKVFTELSLDLRYRSNSADDKGVKLPDSSLKGNQVLRDGARFGFIKNSASAMDLIDEVDYPFDKKRDGNMISFRYLQDN